MTKRILILLFVLMAGALPASAKHHHHSAAASPSPTPDEDDSATPRLGPDGAPITHATSAIVLDARTGQVLCEKNADERRPCASTQKLLTGLIVAEAGGLDRPVTVDISDTWAEPVKLNIQPGETYRRFDLLQVMLVHSMNDVARCLARDNAGSVEAFADRMNHKAVELGMTQSHFVNPNGLPIPDQYTTARDMSKVALAALVERLRARGYLLFDVQMTTEHTTRMGAVNIPRADYLRRLREASRMRHVSFV